MKISYIRNDDRIKRIGKITLYLTDNGTVKIAAPSIDPENEGTAQYWAPIYRLRKSIDARTTRALVYFQLLEMGDLYGVLPDFVDPQDALDLASEISKQVEMWHSLEWGTACYCN